MRTAENSGPGGLALQLFLARAIRLATLAAWIVFGIFTLSGSALSQAPSSGSAFLEGEITNSQGRLKEAQADFAKAVDAMATNPSQNAYAGLQRAKAKAQGIEKFLETLKDELRKARIYESWSGQIQMMAEDSALISAAVDAATGVYDAGKWIFGASDDDIYGQNWQQLEEWSRELVAEARDIRAESKTIAEALRQLENSKDASGLKSDLVGRLAALAERKEGLKQRFTALRPIYKAEKENLPAYTIFHGFTQGRYTEIFLETLDTATLLGYVFGGDVLAPMIDLCKSMLKTRLGEYLAQQAGGNSLTTEIIDELAGSQLFGGGGPPGGFTQFVAGNVQNEATNKLVKEAADTILKADWVAEESRLTKGVWSAFKEEVGKLPRNADFLKETERLGNTADFYLKKAAEEGKEKLAGKMQTWGKRADTITKIWDLIGKDAAQAYMNYGTFKETVGKANGLAKGWRETYKKNPGEFSNEDEYVNDRWKSGANRGGGTGGGGTGGGGTGRGGGGTGGGGTGGGGTGGGGTGGGGTGGGGTGGGGTGGGGAGGPEQPPKPKPIPSCSGATIPLYNDRKEIWKCAAPCAPGNIQQIDWDVAADRENMTCTDPEKSAGGSPEPPQPTCAAGEKLDNVWDEASKSYKDKCIAPKKGDPPGCVYGAPGCSGYKPPDVCIYGAPGCGGYKPPDIDIIGPKERQMNWGEVFALFPSLREKYSKLYVEGRMLLDSTEYKLQQAQSLISRRRQFEATLTKVCNTNINLSAIQADPLATREAIQNAFGPEGGELDLADPVELKQSILKFRNLVANAKSALLGAKTVRSKYQDTRTVMDGLLADWAVYRSRYDEWYKKNAAPIKILNDNLTSIIPATQAQIGMGTGPKGLPDFSSQRLDVLAELQQNDACLMLEKIMDKIESRLVNADAVQKAMANSYPGLRDQVASLQARLKEMSDYAAAPGRLAQASDQDLTRLALATAGKGSGSLRENMLQVAALVPRNQVLGADGKIRDMADKRIVLALADMLSKEPEVSRQLGNLIVLQSAQRKTLPAGALTNIPPPVGGPAGPPGGAPPGPGHAPSAAPPPPPTAPSQTAGRQGASGSAPVASGSRQGAAGSTAGVGAAAAGSQLAATDTSAGAGGTRPGAGLPSPGQAPAAPASAQQDKNPGLIRDMYQRFAQAYQAKDLRGVTKHLASNWQSSGGDSVIDLEDTLGNSFRVFDTIQFQIQGLQIQKANEKEYRVSYSANLIGKISRRNLKHEDNASVTDTVTITPDGPRITKTAGATMWNKK